MGSTPMSRHSRDCMSRRIAWQGISGLMGDMGMESLSSDWAMQQASTRVASFPKMAVSPTTPIWQKLHR